MLRVLTPHHRIASVPELTPDRLRDLGLESLLLDADGTLKRYTSDECAPGVAEWLGTLKQAGIGLCLVSNGLGERIGRFAEKVGLPFVPKAMKPLPRGCRLAMQKMGFRSDSTAMVGDQVFADVMAGRLAGLKTFLVEPIHPEEEPWFHKAETAAGAMVVGKVGPFCRKGQMCSAIPARSTMLKAITHWSLPAEGTYSRLTFPSPHGRIYYR